jgi:hypothetical protein
MYLFKQRQLLYSCFVDSDGAYMPRRMRWSQQFNSGMEIDRINGLYENDYEG